MTLFDFIALTILGVSTLVGLIRGALREVTTVAAFVLAVVIALFALRFTAPMARAAVHPAWAGNAVAVVVVFLAAYVLLRVLAAAATPPEQVPAWIADAKLHPVAEMAATALRTLAPKGLSMAHRLTPALTNAVRGGDPPQNTDGEDSPGTGYHHRARKGLDDAAEKLP